MFNRRFKKKKQKSYTLAIYAYKGELVTCEQGHTICTVGRNIYVGHAQKKGDLVDWQQSEPLIGQKIPCCTICDTEFYRNETNPFVKPNGIHLHIDGKWRHAE